MQVTFREENVADAPAIEQLIVHAYENVGHSDHKEQVMVRRLRGSAAYVPQLSLVAETRKEIAGHIMLTRIAIREHEKSVPSLALAPLSILPVYQKQGVGSALVNEAHKRAKALNFQSIVLLGIAGYYPRFGYVPLKTYDIRVPFEIREQNCMIIELVAGALSGVTGMVDYPPEWTER
jgi:predicted N-acetyltransferase YhbS